MTPPTVPFLSVIPHHRHRHRQQLPPPPRTPPPPPPKPSHLSPCPPHPPQTKPSRLTRRLLPPMATTVAGGTQDGHQTTMKKSAAGQPWSHIETVHLIDAYEERWYALKRGQLKAHQWEDVAAAVAARCGAGLPSPAKSGTQCRHKMEKLRKRYRAERLRAFPSAWPYFNRMDRMERGPLPVSTRSPPPPPAAASLHRSAAVAGGAPPSLSSSGDEEDERTTGSNAGNMSGSLREAGWGPCWASRNHLSEKRKDLEPKRVELYEEEDVSDGDEGDGGAPQAISQLAASVMRLGDELVRMEKRRMKLMKDLERDWMEMEMKRAEMVMESQRCLVEMVIGAFSSSKKAKKSPE